jgi:hypothetical protein
MKKIRIDAFIGILLIILFVVVMTPPGLAKVEAT